VGWAIAEEPEENTRKLATAMSYWLDLFTVQTYEEFQKAGATRVIR
jgi:hypothetical protein